MLANTFGHFLDSSPPTIHNTSTSMVMTSHIYTPNIRQLSFPSPRAPCRTRFSHRRKTFSTASRKPFGFGLTKIAYHLCPYAFWKRFGTPLGLHIQQTSNNTSPTATSSLFGNFSHMLCSTTKTNVLPPCESIAHTCTTNALPRLFRTLPSSAHYRTIPLPLS